MSAAPAPSRHPALAVLDAIERCDDVIGNDVPRRAPAGATALRAPELVEVLGTIPRTVGREVRVSLMRATSGALYLDLRTYAIGLDGRWCPRAGVTISAREIALLLAILIRARRALGALPPVKDDL